MMHNVLMHLKLKLCLYIYLYLYVRYHKKSILILDINTDMYMYIGTWIVYAKQTPPPTGSTQKRGSKTNTFTTKTTIYATFNYTWYKKNIYDTPSIVSIPPHTIIQWIYQLIDLWYIRNTWYHAQKYQDHGRYYGLYILHILAAYIYIYHVTVLIYCVSSSHHLHILFCFAFGHLSNSQMSVLEPILFYNILKYL